MATSTEREGKVLLVVRLQWETGRESRQRQKESSREQGIEIADRKKKREGKRDRERKERLAATSCRIAVYPPINQSVIVMTTHYFGSSMYLVFYGMEKLTNIIFHEQPCTLSVLTVKGKQGEKQYILTNQIITL